jgi:hypothetical protein
MQGDCLANWKLGVLPAFLALVVCGCAQVETTPQAAMSPAGPSVPASNSAPIISGPPLTAIAGGSGYVFLPIASDQDGDTLTFSIQNKPTWATFNVTSGMLSGAPDMSDSSIFNNIIISVSDGVAVTALPAFSISVGAGNTVTAPSPSPRTPTM